MTYSAKMHSADTRLIKVTWDHLAREDPMWFIASAPDKRHRWDSAEFFHTGENDVSRFLAIIARPTAEDAVLLELGCGMGRHSFPFARRFRSVIAVDVSEEMLRLAELRRRELGVSNARFVLNDGQSLSSIQSGSVDVCFSFLCLQHIPSEDIVKYYILEMGRVLRPDGIALFQLPVVPQTVYGRARQLLRTYVNGAFKIGAHASVRLAARLLLNSPAYRGVRLPVDVVLDTVGRAGMQVTSMTDPTRSWQACYQTFVRCDKP